MVKILYKKSYQLNSLKPIKYDDLLGKKGVFSTIRVLGKKNNFILLNNHIKNMNASLVKMNINYVITKKLVLELIKPILKKIDNKDILLRIAISSKTISLSLRKRLQSYQNFSGIIYNYQRVIPHIKNLYYKKINTLLKLINSQKQEVLLSKNGFLLEGCTTNILFIKNKKIFIPKKNFYRGITLNYILKNSKKSIYKSNISINSLDKFEEILLIGSGKGVLKLSSIPQINWKSKSDLVYKELLNLYKKNL